MLCCLSVCNGGEIEKLTFTPYGPLGVGNTLLCDLFFIAKEIANGCLCENIIVGNFLPQLADANAHIALFLTIAFAPYLLQQEAMGKHFARVEQQ